MHPVSHHYAALSRLYIGGLAHVHTRLSNHPGHRESDLTVNSLARLLQRDGGWTTPEPPIGYILINEHSSNPNHPQKLSRLSVRAQQLRRQRSQSSIFGIPVLYGLEVSILSNGATDLTPRLADNCALVIASRHRLPASSEHEASAIMTIFEQGLANPSVDVLGHPTRFIENVEGVDWAKVFNMAAETGTMIEVNLNIFPQPGTDRFKFWQQWMNLLGASEAKVFIGTDLHNAAQVKTFIKWWKGIDYLGRPNPLRGCIQMMVEAGLLPDRVITSDLKTLTNWLAIDKPARSQLSLASEPIENIKHKDVPMNYPQKVHAILSQYHLEAGRVYRNGPRYWVGQVTTQDGSAELLKVVIDNTTWIDRTTGEEHSPIDQLKAEILLFDALGKHRTASGKRAQALIVAAGEDQSWILRRYYTGEDMAAGESPFVFRDEFFEPTTYKLVLDHIADYQELTPLLRESLQKTALGNQHTLASKMHAIDLDNPTEQLAPYAAAMKAYLTPLQEFHDSQLNTLAHGQVYPPHIYLNDGVISFIDWENASLNNPKQDYAALWIRGFGRPAWQKDFVAQMTARGLLASDIDRQLWNIEVLLQSGGNLNYLYWSRIESDEVKAEAIASLKKNIEHVL